MTAIDIAPTFILFAKGNEHRGAGQAEYLVGDGARLPFRGSQFAFATAFYEPDGYGHPRAGVERRPAG